MYCNNFVTLNPSLDWLIFLLTQLKKKGFTGEWKRTFRNTSRTIKNSKVFEPKKINAFL